MTDTEIIKALERVKEQYGVDCYECEYKRLCKNKVCPFRTCDYALNLIERQHADIKRLISRVSVLAEIEKDYALKYGDDHDVSIVKKQIQAEAIIELADKLKKRLERKYTSYGREYVLRHLRELVKEMTEGKK